MLIEDNEKQELSSAFRTAVEIQLSDWSGSTVAMETEPAAKRPKLDRPDFSEILAHDRLCICNAVRRVVVGKNVRPQVWQMFTNGNREHFEFLFYVSIAEHHL